MSPSEAERRSFRPSGTIARATATARAKGKRQGSPGTCRPARLNVDRFGHAERRPGGAGCRLSIAIVPLGMNDRQIDDLGAGFPGLIRAGRPQTHIRTGEPGQDLASRVRVDRVPDCSTITRDGMSLDEARRFHQSQLAADRRFAERQAPRDPRRPHWPECNDSDDLATGSIGEKRDALSVAMRHPRTMPHASLLAIYCRAARRPAPGARHPAPG